MTQNSSMRIVYKDSFKNFYHQMTMLFLAYVVTILGQLHFTGNYIFVVNISASELLPQSSSTQPYFLGAASFSEQLLSWSSFFFRTHCSSQQLFFSKQLLIQSETSTNRLLLVISQLFRTSSFFSRYHFCKRSGTLKRNQMS